MRKILLVGAITLSACAAITSFEQKAGPVIASACDVFHRAEANPLVQVGVAAGSMAANAATGGVAGSAVAVIKSFGDQFCAAGPPAGDTTSPAQQANWLIGVAEKLLRTVGAKP